MRQLCLVLFSAALACGGSNQKPTKPETPIVQVPPKPGEPALVTKTAIGKPKDLSDTVKRGLDWLAKHQLENGAWGQGDEAPGMRGSSIAKDISSVADTSVALLAFLRSGNTPRSGDYQDVANRGIEFVIASVEKSDDSSMYVTDVKGTRVQMKIGQYVDTFAALNLLTEAKGKMRDGVANARLDAALAKVVHKIEKNQEGNGSWAGNGGWAPVLSQALAAKGLNRAAASGTTVQRQTLDRIELQADGDMGGSAGVEVYSTSAKSAAKRDTAVRKKAKVDDMKQKKAAYDAAHHSPDNVPTAAEIAHADEDAKKADKAAHDNERQMITRLEDQRFIAGFGNNGGEEFLSYLLISETLAQSGGGDWSRWDAAISKLVDKVQNEDGSWTGHHCITGRTFCTAAALLVLMGDRTPAAPAAIAS